MESEAEQIERFIARYGEQFRQLIISATKWANENEPKWNLEQPLNRAKFIADLVERAGGDTTDGENVAADA